MSLGPADLADSKAAATPRFFQSNLSDLLAKYPNYFKDILEQPWKEEKILAKLKFCESVFIDNAIFETSYVRNSETVIGVACFVNEKLINTDNLPENAIIQADSINGIKLDQFILKS
jgi:hypothetical protein